MSDRVSEGIPATRRLVLGFDAGCVTCSDLARRIEELAHGKLEMRSLRDPQVEEWRKRALGKDAPWVPTLIRVEGSEIRAWTGWRLGINLSHFLGPVVTWQVIKALGEVRVAPESENSIAFGSVARFTRGQFLRDIGGVVFAVSVLSGTDVFTRRVSALGWVHPLERVKFKYKEELRGEAKQRALKAATDSPDVHNVWSGKTPSQSSVFAVRHTLEDGNTLTAVSWAVDEGKVVVYYLAARPIGNYRSQAMFLTFVPGEEVVKTAESVNGRQRQAFAASASVSQAQGSHLAFRGCGCCRWRWGCVATVGSSCIGCASTCASCIATPAKWTCGACLSCAFVGCPLGIRRCCRRPCG